MTTAESRRHDLYNGLVEFLGADRANTLMTYLPSGESTDLLTRADLDAVEQRLGAHIDGLDARIAGLDTRIDGLDTRIDGLSNRIDLVTQRLDRIVFALVAGLVAIIATLIAQSFV